MARCTTATVEVMRNEGRSLESYTASCHLRNDRVILLRQDVPRASWASDVKWQVIAADPMNCSVKRMDDNVGFWIRPLYHARKPAVSTESGQTQMSVPGLAPTTGISIRVASTSSQNEKSEWLAGMNNILQQWPLHRRYIRDAVRPHKRRRPRPASAGAAPRAAASRTSLPPRRRQAASTAPAGSRSLPARRIVPCAPLPCLPSLGPAGPRTSMVEDSPSNMRRSSCPGKVQSGRAAPGTDAAKTTAALLQMLDKMNTPIAAASAGLVRAGLPFVGLPASSSASASGAVGGEQVMQQQAGKAEDAAGTGREAGEPEITPHVADLLQLANRLAEAASCTLASRNGLSRRKFRQLLAQGMLPKDGASMASSSAKSEGTPPSEADYTASGMAGEEPGPVAAVPIFASPNTSKPSFTAGLTVGPQGHGQGHNQRGEGDSGVVQPPSLLIGAAKQPFAVGKAHQHKGVSPAMPPVDAARQKSSKHRRGGQAEGGGNGHVYGYGDTGSSLGDASEAASSAGHMSYMPPLQPMAVSSADMHRARSSVASSSGGSVMGDGPLPGATGMGLGGTGMVMSTLPSPLSRSALKALNAAAPVYAPIQTPRTAAAAAAAVGLPGMYPHAHVPVPVPAGVLAQPHMQAHAQSMGHAQAQVHPGQGNLPQKLPVQHSHSQGMPDHQALVAHQMAQVMQAAQMAQMAQQQVAAAQQASNQVGMPMAMPMAGPQQVAAPAQHPMMQWQHQQQQQFVMPGQMPFMPQLVPAIGPDGQPGWLVMPMHMPMTMQPHMGGMPGMGGVQGQAMSMPMPMQGGHMPYAGNQAQHMQGGQGVVGMGMQDPRM